MVRRRQEDSICGAKDHLRLRVEINAVGIGLIERQHGRNVRAISVTIPIVEIVKLAAANPSHATINKGPLSRGRIASWAGSTRQQMPFALPLRAGEASKVLPSADDGSARHLTSGDVLADSLVPKLQLTVRVRRAVPLIGGDP